MKKALAFFGGAVLASLVVGTLVFAQNGITPEEQRKVLPLRIAPSSLSRPVPVFDDAIVQFDNLTIQSISGAAFPATITAIPSYEVMSRGDIQKLPRPTPLPESLKRLDASSSKCYVYPDQKSERRTEAACPTPIQQKSSGVTGGAIVPITVLYTIHVGAEARLYLRNRESASLADFTVGNQINVYGFYNDDGTVRALILRNLSRPDEKRFIQLNNVHLISISSIIPPSQLVVAQRPDYPCYGFDVKGEKQTPIVCPTDIQSSRGPSALSGIGVPESLAPIWNTGRRYVVAVDNQTILLDRNRNRIVLGDLAVGDQLNIYGGMNSAGQDIDADIIRDISKPEKPPTAENFGGTVTQVNADGSFVMQTEDGRTMTVLPQIQVGDRVKVKGILDALGQVISQISELTVRRERIVPPSTSIQIRTSSNLIGTIRQSFSGRFEGVGGNPPYDWSVTAGNLPLGLTVFSSTNVSCLNLPPNAGACSPRTRTDSLIEGIPIEDGNFKFQLTAKDQNGNTGSETFVITIRGAVTGVQLPAINEISPGSGPVGTQVKLTGSGFTITGNNVNFAGTSGAVVRLSSPDRKTLVFTIPSTPCAPNMFCAQVVLAPGAYPVSVTNQNGTSNEVKFSVQPGPSEGRGDDLR